MQPMATTRIAHEESSALIGALPEVLFAQLDDPARLGRHMAKPSLMMLGGAMTYELDDAKGQAVGSRIRMSGRAAGIEVFVEERVTARDPPWRKTWETVGRPRLVVMDWYRMGFTLSAEAKGTRLVAFIDFRPSGWPPLVAQPIARAYAGWCLSQILRDAQVAP